MSKSSYSHRSGANLTTAEQKPDPKSAISRLSKKPHSIKQGPTVNHSPYDNALHGLFNKPEDKA